MLQDETERVPVSSWRVALYFLRLGAVGFGGPIALVGRMQQDLVDERRWVTRKEYLEGLALSQLALGVATFVVLFRFKVSQLWLIAAAAGLGCVAPGRRP